MRELITDNIYGTLGHVESTPRETIRLDHTNLCPDIPTDKRFNSSIIESNGQYLIAFRHDWRHSRIYAAWLDQDFKPTGQYKKLELPHGASMAGEEDPRWCRIGGKLHLWFVRFFGRGTSVMLAMINEETLEVESLVWPQLYPRTTYEKNWPVFDYEGVPHFIYSSKPSHSILKLKDCEPGDDPLCEWAYSTPFNGTWSGGFMRGGASPVQHNGRWLHFFHGSTVQANGRRLYNVGLIEFEATPPFRITRYTQEPFDIADPNVTPKAEKSDVIFPCGAVLVDGHWAISFGCNDTWTEIRFYDAGWIESLLVRHDA